LVSAEWDDDNVRLVVEQPRCTGQDLSGTPFKLTGPIQAK
jgi:hypothetical protein